MTTDINSAKRKVRVSTSELARRAAIRQAMSQAGISISAWAKANNFNHQIVQGVLAGTFTGDRGEARAVCIALKLKTGEVVAPAAFNPESALRELAAA